MKFPPVAVRLCAVTILAALLLFVTLYPTSAIPSAVAAILLVYVTIEYVLANQQSLTLLNRQWELQNTPAIRFGVTRSEAMPYVWIANFGYSSFMVSKLVIRRKDEPRFQANKHLVVPAGRLRRIKIPEKLWEDAPLFVALDLRLSFHTPIQFGDTEAKAFTLHVNNRKVYKIRRGIHDLWDVKCPKCGRWDGICMEADGLSNFDEAQLREKEMQSELRASCPEHQSQWLLTVDSVRKARATSEEEDF